MRIKYKGQGSRVIAGTRIFQGEIRELNDKLAVNLQGDPDIEFLDKGTGDGGLETEAVLPEEPEVKESEAPKVEKPEAPKPVVKKSRSKRK